MKCSTKEEMMWVQRSRVSGLKEAGQNTKFFHQRAAWHARRNKVRKLIRNADGTWCPDKARYGRA
jgi:hypothetical protein